MQSLKETIIESYTSIVYGVSEGHDTSILDIYINDITQFLTSVSNAEIENDFAKQIAGLIGDIANLYGGKVQSFIQLPIVKVLLKKLEQSPIREYKQTAKWLQAGINKANKQK